jgi:hypothetical protein
MLSSRPFFLICSNGMVCLVKTACVSCSEAIGLSARTRYGIVGTLLKQGLRRSHAAHTSAKVSPRNYTYYCRKVTASPSLGLSSLALINNGTVVSCCSICRLNAVSIQPLLMKRATVARALSLGSFWKLWVRTWNLTQSQSLPFTELDTLVMKLATFCATLRISSLRNCASRRCGAQSYNQKPTAPLAANVPGPFRTRGDRKLTARRDRYKRQVASSICPYLHDALPSCVLLDQYEVQCQGKVSVFGCNRTSDPAAVSWPLHAT